MPKRQLEINKTNQARISKWIKTFIAERIDNVDLFESAFSTLVLDEVKTHKECTEKSVITAFINAFQNYIQSNDSKSWNDIDIKECIRTARKELSVKYTTNNNFNNNIDIYFNDVKREYIMHPMNESDYLEFIPENRDIFIKNNLKLVVNCAKHYRGLGIPFEDLIQAGNYGLVVAFEKFDTSRSKLRNSIIENIEKSKKKKFTYDSAKDIVSSAFLYDKDLERTLKTLPAAGFANKEEFTAWTMKNVKTAVFASVAFQWIRGYILLELGKTSSLVKVPKPKKRDLTEDEILAGIDDEKTGPSVVSLDTVNPHTNDNYHDNQMAGVATEQFAIEDGMIDAHDNEILFKDIISKSIAKLSDINRRIIKKRFGISYPAPLNVIDIAESEGIATNRVKYIISSCLQELARNMSQKDKNILAEIFDRDLD